MSGNNREGFQYDEQGERCDDQQDYDAQYDDEYDEHDNYPLRHRKNAVAKKNWLEDFINPSMHHTMQTPIFKLIQGWVLKEVGLDLTPVVWAITMLIPVGKYTVATLNCIKQNGTNTLRLGWSDALTQDLLAWVADQPANQWLSWLPTFRPLQWKPVSYNKRQADPDAETHELAAAQGCTFFFFQGIPFILETPDNNGFEIILRCFWGSSEPIKALINHVRKENSDQVLRIRKIRGERETKTMETRKRPLYTIDMEPIAKQGLISDVQAFFDPQTEDWYVQNGRPYRRGYLFSGPPGTGKTSLAQAIASEYDLELFVFFLEAMDDAMLEKRFQELPKKCVVLFEDIDSAGIVRENPKAKKAKRESDDDETAFDSDEEQPLHALSGPARAGRTPSDTATGMSDKVKGNAKADKPQEKKPQRTQVTLSGLLNTIDGPGAKEGRLLILTTNAPKSLDHALIRSGRIDKKYFLGFSTPMTAAITFERMFGTDPLNTLSKATIRNMAMQFGKLIPEKTFTPSQIQDYCGEFRNQPQAAINTFPEWIRSEGDGLPKFEYDINEYIPGDKTASKTEREWGEQLFAWTSGKYDVEVKQPKVPNKTSSQAPRASRPSRSSSTFSNLWGTVGSFLADFDRVDDDALAYGTFHPIQLERPGEMCDGILSTHKSLQRSSGKVLYGKHPSPNGSVSGLGTSPMPMPPPQPMAQRNVQPDISARLSNDQQTVGPSGDALPYNSQSSSSEAPSLSTASSSSCEQRSSPATSIAPSISEPKLYQDSETLSDYFYSPAEVGTMMLRYASPKPLNEILVVCHSEDESDED